MTLYLLDTNIISSIVRDPQGPVATKASGAPPSSICTSVIVAGEIEYGFAKMRLPKLQRQATEIMSGIDVLAIEPGVGAHYGSIRSALEKDGTPIGENDLWIAAHALALGATLVTANEREFRRVPGLAVENWAA